MDAAQPVTVEPIKRGTLAAWLALVTEEEVAAAWRQNAADFERQRREFAALQERWWQKWWRKRSGASNSPALRNTPPHEG